MPKNDQMIKLHKNAINSTLYSRAAVPIACFNNNPIKRFYDSGVEK